MRRACAAAMRSASAKVMKRARRRLASVSGKSLRQWPPRISWRASARRRHQLGRRQHVEQRRLAVAGAFQPRDHGQRLAQTLRVAFQADIAAHGVAQHMRRRGQRRSAAGAGGVAAAPSRRRACALDVLGHAGAEHQRLPAANWRPAGWRRADRWRRIRPPPTGRAAKSGHARPWRCRPCDNARRAPPGWAGAPDRCPAVMQAA